MKLASFDQLSARTGASLYLFWGLAFLALELAFTLDYGKNWFEVGIGTAVIWGTIWLGMLLLGRRAQLWFYRLAIWLWFASIAYLLGISLIDILANPDLDSNGQFTVSDLWPIAQLLLLSPGYISLQLYGELPVYIDMAQFLELQTDLQGVVWFQVWSLSLLHYLLILQIVWFDRLAEARFGERLEEVETSLYFATSRRRPLED
ncbi:MAG: hypothetical protein HWE12_00205 [Oceanospirillaceae bacterium]|nr:hypothetical protein [Oceanospirillaceae bacterium]